MLRVGPNSLADFQLNDAAFHTVYPGKPVLLGPVPIEDPAYWITRLFLVMGKLIHLRRLGMPESESLPGGFEAEYRQWLTAVVDQAVSGSETEYAHLIQLAQGLTGSITAMVRQIQGFARGVDTHVIRLLEGEVVPGQLTLNPAEPLTGRVDQLIQFMGGHGIALEDNAGGFRDYLMETLTTSDGLPAAFPISVSNPRVLDAWITDEVLTVEDVYVTESV